MMPTFKSFIKSIGKGAESGAAIGLLGPVACVYKIVEKICYRLGVDHAGSGAAQGAGIIAFPATAAVLTLPATLPIGVCLLIPGALVGAIAGPFVYWCHTCGWGKCVCIPVQH
jgi:hypothetical protein